MVCQDSKVRLVDDEGLVKAAYTSRQSFITAAIYLAVTDAGFLLVLDAGKKRVRMLAPDLSHVRDVVTPEHGLQEPRFMWWDDVNNRLYVAETVENIRIFHLLP